MPNQIKKGSKLRVSALEGMADEVKEVKSVMVKLTAKAGKAPTGKGEGGKEVDQPNEEVGKSKIMSEFIVRSQKNPTH